MTSLFALLIVLALIAGAAWVGVYIGKDVRREAEKINRDRM